MYCTCLLAMPVPQKPRPITLMDPSLLLCVIMYIETLILLGHCTYSMWQMSAESAQGFPRMCSFTASQPHHTFTSATSHPPSDAAGGLGLGAESPPAAREMPVSPAAPQGRGWRGGKGTGRVEGGEGEERDRRSDGLGTEDEWSDNCSDMSLK